MQKDLFDNWPFELKTEVPTDVDVPDTSNMPPETVNVLGRTFTVKILSPDENEDCDGFMDLTSQVIGVRLQAALDYNQDTVLHEVIHAVDETLGLGLKEKQVHQLAVGLIAVLKQNKEFATWLLKNDSR